MQAQNSRIVIYQLIPRLFGNLNEHPVFNGSKTENGCGTLDDLNDKVLSQIKELGVSHIWLTGILRHATQTDYSDLGMPAAHPDVVKGKAGSPYAVTDFFDLDPDLFTNPENCWKEFQDCLQRIQAIGLKVIIDFIPNHTAREYTQLQNPNGLPPLGQADQINVAFLPSNNYYYFPGESLSIEGIERRISDNFYVEFPAKATGNDCFSAHPSVFDWYETVKLNYGIDYRDGTQHFYPIPATWNYMLEVLHYWAGLGVDGFRCDMAEMVPVAFWQWALPKVRLTYPLVLFIAEVYDNQRYREFLEVAGFDLLYDKVGLYDQVIAMLKGQNTVAAISSVWKNQEGIQSQMLRFTENHDEQRTASVFVAGSGQKALVAFALTAFFDTAALMIYFGQELGEAADGEAGFSGNDGKTTIFDYGIVPSIQRWILGNSIGDELNLRSEYQQIIRLCLQPAFSNGSFFDLQYAQVHKDAEKTYCFLRFNDNDKYLVICHFSDQPIWKKVIIPKEAWGNMKLDPNQWLIWEDMWTNEKIDCFGLSTFEADGGTAGLLVSLAPWSFRVFKMDTIS